MSLPPNPHPVEVFEVPMNNGGDSAWLTLIGVGENGLADLSEAAACALAAARLVICSQRLRPSIAAKAGRECLSWPKPLNTVIKVLQARRGQPVCVLATGDPFHYGVANVLLRHFSIDEVICYPHPSAFSLACARLGWERARVQTLSLHGRPLAVLHAHLQPRVRLLLLTANAEGPRQIAEALVANGFGASCITILNQLGSEDEWCDSCLAAEFTIERIAARNTVAIECVADAATRWYSRAPGLTDEAYLHDGQLTKRVVRAATVAALAPAAEHVLWDVGAGAGSVAIEWLRTAAAAEAYAIERSPARCEIIRRNATALGTPGLIVLAGEAPEALHGLPDPDAVFIGGSVADGRLLDTCWQRLNGGGRLVANAVTLAAEAELLARHRVYGGELARIGVAHAASIGDHPSFTPSRSITQWVVHKA